MNTAGKGSIMQELTKCKQNVLPPLNWRSTWLNVALCAHTRGERGGVSCGSVSICSEPHPALYCVCTLTSHPLNMTLSCSPRAENKHSSTLNSQQLLPVSSLALLLQVVALEKLLWVTWQKRKTKVQQKRLTNKISYVPQYFSSRYIKACTFFWPSRKYCTNNINILFLWQWYELFNQ